MHRLFTVLVLLALLGGAGQSWAGFTYQLSVSDANGSIGTASVLATGPTLAPDGNPDAFWVTNGSFTFTPGNDLGLSGTYPLAPGGPGSTTSSLPAPGAFFYDNLLYPNNDATAGYYSPTITPPSYLDNYGLAFANSFTEFNVFSNGNMDYAFAYSNPTFAPVSIGYTTGVHVALSSAVPEPASLTLLTLGGLGLLLARRRRAVGLSLSSLC